MIEKWTKESSEYLFRDPPWLTLRKDRVRIPNGNYLDPYYILEYPNWVNVIAITKDGHIVLIKQYRHGIEEVHFEIPAGVCDPEDSSPMESAKRELLEETGYGDGIWSHWMTLCANPGTHTNRSFTYIATDVQKLQDPSLEESEDISVHLTKNDKVIEILEEGKIIQSLHAAPLWRYIAQNQTAIPGL